MKSKKEQYSFVCSHKTKEKAQVYLNMLKKGSIQPGRFLRDLLILSMEKIGNLSSEKLLEYLVQTRQAFIVASTTSSTPLLDENWNRSEISLLSDLSCCISTQAYDNGDVVLPKRHEKPLPLTLIYVSAPLLSIDFVRVKFNQDNYCALLKERILPGLLHANQLAESANKTFLINMPTVGFDQFRKKAFYRVLHQLLTQYSQQLRRIKGLIYEGDASLPKVQRIGSVHLINRSFLKPELPPFSHPCAYGSRYASSELLRFVSSDFLSGQSTSGIRVTSTDALSVLTGFEGVYENNQVVPKDAPQQTWSDFTASQGGIWLNVVNNLHAYSDKPLPPPLSKNQHHHKLEAVLRLIKTKERGFKKTAKALYDERRKPEEQSEQQKKYASAATAAFNLHQTISTAYAEYERDQNKVHFLDKVRPAIETARKSELKNHRGYKELLGQGGLLIVAIGSLLGLAYLLGRYAYGRQGFFPVEFKTDSIHHIEELEVAFNRIISV